MTTSRTGGLPVVAIVGRPNVGKSLLFNRLTRTGAAVVDDRPGVTRDRNYHETVWNGQRFLLVDTGGLLPSEDRGIMALVRVQAESAIREADAILFVVDRTTGPVPIDSEIATLLRRSPKPIILAVNKVDAEEHELDAHEFSRLSLGDPMPVSALHGRRTGDLLDAIVAVIPKVAPEDEAEPGIRVAFVGRPNVGKSSLVNRIVGQEVAIVDAEPGTTRDAVDTVVTAEGTRFVLVDTAGLKRHAKLEPGVEFYSYLRALRSIERANVVVLVVDATTGILAQDARIAGLADEAGKALIVAFNKWDLVERDGANADLAAKHTQTELTFASYAPIMQVSALTGQRVAKILPLAREVYEQASTRRATHEVNDAIMKAVARRPPAAGRRANILYATQTGVRPPTFVVFTNDLRAIDHAYRRYLVNQLRREYGFAGTPIRIITKRKKK
jgi:GTP-binding protein